jgi:hypothetical protein
MRDSYEDSPAGTREAGLRRLGRLTWRTTQLGALATVGFAIVFARTAPAPAANVQTAPPTESAKPTASPHATVPHGKKPRRGASARSAPALQPGAQQTTQAAAQPAPQPTTQAPAPAPSPTLAPPTTAPAPAPSTASPVPTVTSTTHGGG